jgi:hypothetical protein
MNFSSAMKMINKEETIPQQTPQNKNESLHKSIKIKRLMARCTKSYNLSRKFHQKQQINKFLTRKEEMKSK